MKIKVLVKFFNQVCFRYKVFKFRTLAVEQRCEALVIKNLLRRGKQHSRKLKKLRCQKILRVDLFFYSYSFSLYKVN